MLGRKMYLALLPVLLAGAAALMAGPALTTIEDTLYRADGSKFTGVVFIEWKTFEAGDTTNVPARNLTVRITAGLLRVSLVPTTNASPGAYYRVRYNSDGRTDFVESWSVPPSIVPLRVRDVRTLGPQAGGPVPPINTVITIPDVNGLRDELDNRPTKGGSFLPGRVVTTNLDGSLETVAGNDGDCVRADGTTGPCGGGGGHRYVDAESPAGAIDGVNRTFTLSEIPVPPASLGLYRSGLRLRSPADFLVTGNQIQFTAGEAPQPGDTVTAFYTVADPFAGQSPNLQTENPAGTVDGVNAQFQLSSAPAPPGSLQLFRNGLLLKLGLDFDLSGPLVTFRPGAIPQAGDELTATYRN